MLQKIVNPVMRQVDQNKAGYFEGWYFKQVSQDGKVVASFIPGFSTRKDDEHSFIQYIIAEDDKVTSGYVRYEMEELSYNGDPFCVKIGKSTFSREGISIHLEDEGYVIKGEVTFGEMLDIDKNIYAPNIMGPFAYIPFMECSHGVVSLDHDLSGDLLIAGDKIDFTGGRGYIEKDWGRSFPRNYIWLQCNGFKSGASLFLSVAHIPFGAVSFGGFIGIYHDGKKEHRFATYLGGGIRIVDVSDEGMEVELWKGSKRLFVKVSKKAARELIAPVAGGMSKVIKEAISAVVDYSFIDKKTGEVIEERGFPGSYEVVGDVKSL